MGVERERVESFGRLAKGLRQAGGWYLWGPYLSERQWGTVREDYSADGEAWSYLPHDHARSQAYRWGEDGLAGFSDVEQRLCLALALWNGRDPILKERTFGLTGAEGNHGEDVKEYWWYLDAVPSHAWNRWRYHYPQRAFPYEHLRRRTAAAAGRTRSSSCWTPGCSTTTGTGSSRSTTRRPDPTDLLMTVRGDQRGPGGRHAARAADRCGAATPGPGIPAPPRRRLRRPARTTVGVPHPFLGELELVAGPARTGPHRPCCSATTRPTPAGCTASRGAAFPKDGINDHVVAGAATVNPERRGSKCAAWYRVTVEPGADGRAAAAAARPPGGADRPGPRTSTQVRDQRRAEADEFYAELTPAAASADEALVMRQAFAGMLWSKQLYYYDVAPLARRRPGQPAPPAVAADGPQRPWRNFNAFDIMSMPDKWEYPWFAAWDLAFHCVALAHVDPASPSTSCCCCAANGSNTPTAHCPPTSGTSATSTRRCRRGRRWRCSPSTAAATSTSCRRVFDKLLLNFTWWVNLQDADGSNLFEGGFLGPGQHRPARPLAPAAGSVLEQSDAHRLDGHLRPGHGVIAMILQRAGSGPTDDLVQKFLEHFAAIRAAIEHQGLWDASDGLFYDRLALPDGSAVPVRVRSMVGIIPMLAAGVADEDAAGPGRRPWQAVRRVPRPEGCATARHCASSDCCAASRATDRCCWASSASTGSSGCSTSCSIPPSSCPRTGCARCRPTTASTPTCSTPRASTPTIDYEPAESTTAMFGGNSNWRGPSGSR